MSIDVYAGILYDNALTSVGTQSINMTERNFVIMMDAIGFVVNESCGHIDIDKFLTIARTWLQRHIDKPSAEVASREHTTNTGGCRMIDLPLRAGYVNQRLHQIVTMLDAGKRQGATHIYWG